MKQVLPIILTITIIVNQSSQAQTLGKIKNASDEHNSSKGSSEGGASSSSSDSYSESSSSDYYYYDSSPDDNYPPPTVSSTPRVPREPRPVVIHRDFDIRQSIDNRKVSITNVQYSRAKNGYFTSYRYNYMSEPRVKENESFSTFEAQLIGFNTMTKPFNLAMATGFYMEFYSGAVFWEHLARIKWDVIKNITLNLEGRLALDKGVEVRTEGTVAMLAKLKEWNKTKLSFGAFFTSALYYKTVPVENLGANIRLSF